MEVFDVISLLILAAIIRIQHNGNNWQSTSLHLGKDNCSNESLSHVGDESSIDGLPDSFKAMAMRVVPLFNEYGCKYFTHRSCDAIALFSSSYHAQ